MTTITTAVQPGAVQSAPKKKKKPGVWSRARKSFVTSKYVTKIWEWFLSLAARLVQPVLFITVMYSIAETYPGFTSPGKLIDQGVFLLQNGALDIGSFGLPKLAAQAEKEGNEEGAEKARKTGRALFVIMVSNLVWGGIEHVFPGLDPVVKTVAMLVFTVVRAYYAITYTSVVHSLEKPEEEEESEQVQDPAPSPVAPATIDYAALVDLLKPHLEQIKSSLAVDLKPVVPALDYLALAKAVAPHIEARSTEPDLKPVVLDLTQVDLSPVALTESQVDLSPVEPALSPVALALTRVASSPVPPKEPGPEPLVKARATGLRAGGSELEKSSRAGSEPTKEPLKSSVVAPKSGNEERDQKLAAAYAELIAEGLQVSGRTLAGRAKCARPAANEWLQVHRSSGSGSESGGSEASASGSDSSGSGFKSSTSGSGSNTSGSESSSSGSGEVGLKPRSRVRNTDELVALDLEVSNAG